MIDKTTLHSVLALYPMLRGLPEAELAELRGYVERVLEHRTRGLDKLFQAAATSTRYIPNFILKSIIDAFVEPIVAARIAAAIDDLLRDPKVREQHPN